MEIKTSNLLSVPVEVAIKINIFAICFLSAAAAAASSRSRNVPFESRAVEFLLLESNDFGIAFNWVDASRPLPARSHSRLHGQTS